LRDRSEVGHFGVIKQRSAFLQTAIFIVVVVLLFWALRQSPVVGFIEDVQRKVAQLGMWAPVCYPLVFAVCNLLLLPGGVLCVGSGFLFGLWWGFALVLIGNTISAAIAFATARSILQRWVREKLRRKPVLNRLEPAIERQGWKIIILSQLHPLFPTSLLNYFYGLTNIRFGTFLIFATLGRVPGLFLYVYLGTLGQFGIKLARGSSHPRLLEYWIWGGAFLFTALLLLVLGRIATEAVDGQGARSARH
jgi:uncharacterized membrane protein YdjX (TVP38/TMEM64 family)